MADEDVQDLQPAYQLKISLRGERPPIWRRVLVPPETTYDDLHRIILVLFGWSGEHLHEFEWGARWKRRGKTLAEKGYEPGDKLLYVYDFGDCWGHSITFEKFGQVRADVGLPVCTRGKRAAPPEDCGDYQTFLAAIGDPDHEDDQEVTEWYGGSFDPEAFDIREVNELLKPLRARFARRAVKAEKAGREVAHAPVPRKLNSSELLERVMANALAGARAMQSPGATAPAAETWEASVAAVVAKVRAAMAGPERTPEPPDETTAAIGEVFRRSADLIAKGSLVPVAMSLGQDGGRDVHLPPSLAARIASGDPRMELTDSELALALTELIEHLRPIAPAMRMVMVGRPGRVVNSGMRSVPAILLTVEERDGSLRGAHMEYTLTNGGIATGQIVDSPPDLEQRIFA